MKKYYNKACQRLWIAVNNKKGTIVTENLLVMVAIVVAVFAIAAIVFTFLGSYSESITEDIKSKGGIGSDFGGGVTFE